MYAKYKVIIQPIFIMIINPCLVRNLKCETF